MRVKLTLKPSVFTAVWCWTKSCARISSLEFQYHISLDAPIMMLPQLDFP